MINLEILSEDKILTLKNNQKEVLKHILSSNDNSWLCDFFKEENPFSKSEIFIDEFKLDLSRTNSPEQTDFENARKIFENLKINDSQACDERLWVSLSFGIFYSYMKYRWKMDEIKKLTTNIKYRWFNYVPGRRSLVFQGISKLWWFIKLTIDEGNADDPYYLSKYYANHIKIYERTFYRNFSSSDNVRMGMLKAIYDFDLEYKVMSLALFDELAKYISFLGGAHIIDFFSEDEIYNKCYKKLKSLYAQANPNQKIFKL